MKHSLPLFFVLIASTSALGDTSTPAPCDLNVVQTQSFEVRSSQTNNYSSNNYTNAVEEIREQCAGGSIGSVSWHRTQVSLGVEYGYYSATCMIKESLSPEEMKKRLCNRTLECIAVAKPDESIDWLVAKQKAFGCNQGQESSK